MSNRNSKKTIQAGILIAFFLLIMGYALFGSKDLIVGVKIKDVNIENGKSTEENVLNIAGNARHALELTLNGRAVSIDEEGNFSETIALLLGYNTINIEARDKFGNTDEKTYQLTYVPKETEERQNN